VIGFFRVMSPVVGREGWSLRSFLLEKSNGWGHCLGEGEFRGCFTGVGWQPVAPGGEARVPGGTVVAPLGSQ
jgi:hypothetical protein